MGGSVKQNENGNTMRVFKWFVIFSILDPLIYIIMLRIMPGIGNSLRTGIITAAALPILTAAAIYTLLLSMKGNRIIRRLSPGDEAVRAEAETFFRYCPYKISAVFFTGNAAVAALPFIPGFFPGVHHPWESALYFTLTGVLEAALFSLLLYYITRVELYPLNKLIRFKTLTIFMKIYVPVITIITAALLVSSLTIYRVMYPDLADSGIAQMKKSLHISADDATAIFRAAALKLDSSIIAWGYSSISPDNIRSLLDRMKKNEKDSIEVFFGGDNSGNILTDTGSRINISDRDYFIEMKNVKHAVFSDVLASRATGVQVIVAVVPHLMQGSVNGLLGATVKTESVKQILKKNGEVYNADFILTASDGTVISASDDSLNGKNFGGNIADDGKNFINTPVMLSQYDTVSQVRLNGTDYAAMTVPVELLNARLTVLVKQPVFFRELNNIILTLTAMQIVIFAMLTGLIIFIARGIARPIKDSITFLGMLAEGDFSATYVGTSHDELSGLADALNISVITVRNILSAIIASSENLSSVITEISRNNRDLSQITTEQNSSLEQIASALEETSASIRQNAENTGIARILI